MKWFHLFAFVTLVMLLVALLALAVLFSGCTPNETRDCPCCRAR